MFTASNLVVFSKNHQTLVKNISLSINKGEILALLGINGAGKTSIALAITGHLPCKADLLEINNTSIQGMMPYDVAKSGISFVTEEKLLFQDMSVQENLEVAMSFKELFPKKEAQKERFDFVFSLFPRLYERLNQKAKTLSGGEQQMLSLSRALMQNPLMLILDEPSQGLSVQMVDLLFKALDELKEKRLSILLIEQNTSRSLNIANHAVILKGGSVILEGAAPDIKNTKDLMKICIGV